MPEPLELEIALQGGGAHGAFTWGVLHRLLDEPRLNIGAMSGASAGALNAVALASGMLDGGRSGAQKALWALWKRIARGAHGRTWAARPFNALFMTAEPSPGHSLGFTSFWTAPWIAAADAFTRSFSPYQFNPFNLNPLIDLLRDQIDFAGLAGPDAIRLFVSATSVRTGVMRVFRNTDLSAEAVMASACLPHLFQAVEIDGEPYWDGGYSGNPALLPLIAESAPHDLLIVQLNPPVRQDLPRTATAILGRLSEITFNASLVKELTSIGLLREALAAEGSEGRSSSLLRHPLFDQVRDLRLHRISADAAVFDLGVSSKLNPQWEYLISLHGEGVRAADSWLSAHGADLGRRSTLDLARL